MAGELQEMCKCGNVNCGNVMMMTTVAIGITLATHYWSSLGAQIHKYLMTDGNFGSTVGTAALGWRDSENSSDPFTKP